VRLADGGCVMDGTRMDLLTSWKDAIKQAGFYKLHSCSMCGYDCGWFFDNEQMYYDSGCDCTRRYIATPSPISDLYFYLNPSHGHISNIEKFIAMVHSK
jgi:hypothetical protein